MTWVQELGPWALLGQWEGKPERVFDRLRSGGMLARHEGEEQG
jgi:hypothetical protein